MSSTLRNSVVERYNSDNPYICDVEGREHIERTIEEITAYISLSDIGGIGRNITDIPKTDGLVLPYLAWKFEKGVKQYGFWIYWYFFSGNKP